MSLAGRTGNRHHIGNRLAIVIVLGLVLVAFPGFAEVYDVAADFSPTSNPAGPWSYGWSAQLTSALDLYSYSGTDRDIDLWSDFANLYPPQVAHNGTDNEIFLVPELVTYQPGQFALHPGGSGEYSHARWTAPTAITCNISAEFTGIDQDGPTTDVHVFHNTTSLFTGSVDGYGDSASFSTTISVTAGDFIDFAVGYGTGGYAHDQTALAATILTGTAAVDDGSGVPNLNRLVGIYPNPFNPQTTIAIYLDRPQRAKIAVYDLTGQLLGVLANRSYDAGNHSIAWYGEDAMGRAMPSGTYIVRLETESGVEARKAVLAR